MVRGTFSPARAWRPAVGPASPQTLGISKTIVRYSVGVCACRRELNSQDARQSRDSHRICPTVTGCAQSTGRNKQPDFSQGRPCRPVKTHDEAAGGGKKIAVALFEHMARAQCFSARHSTPRTRDEEVKEFTRVAQSTGRVAPCRVLGLHRRCGVPRVLSLWRETGNRGATHANAL